MLRFQKKLILKVRKCFWCAQHEISEHQQRIIECERNISTYFVWAKPTLKSLVRWYRINCDARHWILLSLIFQNTENTMCIYLYHCYKKKVRNRMREYEAGGTGRTELGCREGVGNGSTLLYICWTKSMISLFLTTYPS